MALPGLGDEDVPVFQEQEAVIHDLAAGSEWRFEITHIESVEIKLVSGSAELFGTELAPQHTYTFRGLKAAIYTHSGASISSLGVLHSDYIADETPLTSYVNLHFALESLRSQAANTSSSVSAGGPRVLLLGPPSAGRTSLSKLLTAYALRSGAANVMAVNLDPKEGLLTVPGTLSAAALSGTLDVEAQDGWGSAPTNGPMPVPAKLPLVYYFGHETTTADERGYKALVTRLAIGVKGRLDEDPEARRAGVILDTPGSLGTGKSGSETEIVEHIVGEFGVDVLVVLGSERLYSEMTRRFTRPGITIVKLDRSGGVAERDASWTAHERQEQVHEYFYGDGRVSLNPHSTFVDWGEVAIFKLSTSGTSSGGLDVSLLPGGVAGSGLYSVGKEKVLGRVTEMDPELHNSVLAIVNVEPSAKEEDIRQASVLGFVHVAEVDEKRKRLKVLAPLSGRLPRRTLVWGDWPEGMQLDSTTAR